MIGLPGNIWGALKDKVNNKVWDLVGSGAPVDGTSGTAVSLAGSGSSYTDIVTGIRYFNIGTLVSPVWTTVGTVIANGGLGVVGNAKMTYDFAVDGGAISTITPTNSPTIPINAIILGGTIDIITTLVGATATISLGTSAGSNAASLKAATAVASWTAGQLALTPVFTAATYVKLTAAGRPTLTIAVAALTAGKFNVNLVYVIGN